MYINYAKQTQFEVEQVEVKCCYSKELQRKNLLSTKKSEPNFNIQIPTVFQCHLFNCTTGFSLPFSGHFYQPAQAIFGALKSAENTHDLLLKMASEIEDILANIAALNFGKVRRTFFSGLAYPKKIEKTKNFCSYKALK